MRNVELLPWCSISIFTTRRRQFLLGFNSNSIESQHFTDITAIPWFGICPNDNICNIVCNSCWFHKMMPEKALRLYFLAPSVLFFSLIWLPWHFLHRVVEIGFLLPHLKHILKYSLRCCAICFFAASVIGILLFLLQERALFYLSISILFRKDIHYDWIFFVVPFWLCKKWIQSTQNMTNIRDGKIIDQRIMMGPYILAPR